MKRRAGARMDDRNRMTEWTGREEDSFGTVPESLLPGEAAEEKSFFSGLSLALGLIGFLLLMIPVLSLPVSIMAILFGVLSLTRGEFRRSRAVTGIVIGSCLLLFSATMLICMSALSPYQDDLIRMFNEYLQRNR